MKAHSWFEVFSLAATVLSLGSTVGAELNGPWRLRFPLPSDAFLSSIAYGAGRFVAVADTSGLVSSGPSGWTNVDFGIANTVTAVIPGDVGFVAVGLSESTPPTWFPLIATSTDGLTWRPHLIQTFKERLIGVAHGNGLYAAISSTGLWTSPDGVTWTSAFVVTNLTGPTATPLTAITFGGGRFVALGEGFSIASSDGVFWATHATGTNATMNAVTFGQGRFVAVGSYGTVLTSTDGASWIPARGGTNEVPLYGVSYGNGRFVAVGFEVSTSVILGSTNGLSWSPANNPTSLPIDAVTFGQNAFLAVGAPGVVLSSSDGVIWTNQGTPSYELGGLAYGRNTFVATASNQVLTSPDGVTWSSHSVAVPPRLGDVTFTGDRFFSLSSGIYYNGDAVNGISTSIDGTNWERSMVWTNGTTTVSVSLPAYGRNAYVAVGNSFDSVANVYSTYSFVSADGLKWDAHELNTKDSLLQIVYANGQFTVVGTGNAGMDIFTSVDGVSWVRAASALLPSPWGSLAFGNGTFVTATMEGFLVSHDGVSWRALSPGFDQLIYDVAYGDGLFVASGAAGFVLTSADGDKWTVQNIGTYNWLWRCAYANRTFLAASGAALYQSPELQIPGFRLDPPQLLPSGAVQVLTLGTTGQNFQVQASSDLQSWALVATASSTNSGTAYLDTNAIGALHRFYRAVQR